MSDRDRDTVASLLETHPDDVVAIHEVTWAQYEVILEAIGENPVPRTSYLDGELNLLRPGRAHEWLKTSLGRLIETFADVRDLPLEAFGSPTFKKDVKKAGLEPDECYSIGHAREIPDFAVDIVIKWGTVERADIYARFGFREAWFWEKGKIAVYSLSHGRAPQRRRASRFLKKFPFAEVERLLLETPVFQQSAAVKAFRRWLEAR